MPIPEELGEGKITGFNFNHGLGIILVNGRLKKDWQLIFDTSVPSLLMSFNVKGEFWHNFNHNQIQYQANPLQGSITANPAGSQQSFNFPSRMDLLFMTIHINRSSYLKKVDCMVEKMPNKLADVFLDKKAENPFFYQSNYSIASAECINDIVENKSDGLPRSTFVEGKTLELLSKQLRQFEDDMNSPSKKVTLRKFDLEKIQLARKILKERLDAPPTIEELAIEIGINRQKLKKGFKLVYESTINEYVRNERMEKAALLLLDDRSVKNAAETVGYVNIGHFAKKFKEKYGVLPKDYLKSIQQKIDQNN